MLSRPTMGGLDTRSQNTNAKNVLGVKKLRNENLARSPQPSRATTSSFLCDTTNKVLGLKRKAENANDENKVDKKRSAIGDITVESLRMDKSIYASNKDCQVCFHVFDGRDRRPRCIPCGHTFCTKCVSENLKKNVFPCPFCHVKHEAKAPTDFPVNYMLENVCKKQGDGLLNSPETPEPSSDPPQGLNKKMKSMRQELITSIESLGESSQGITSQLQVYKTCLEDWEDQHNQSAKTFRNISHQHEEMAKSISKENRRVSEAIKKEEEERQSMNMAKAKLLAAKINKEVLPAIEEATQYFDIMDSWINDAQEVFPNVKLITDGLMLQERAKTMRQKLTEHDKMVAAIKTEDESMTDNVSQALKVSLSHEATTSTDSSIAKASLPESVSPKLSATVEEKLKDALETAFLVGKFKSRKVVQDKENQTEFDAPKDPIIQNIPVELARDVESEHTTSNSGDSIFGTSDSDSSDSVIASDSDALELAMPKKITPLVKKRIEAGKVFALKEQREGEKRYAKITLHEDQLHLHVLSPHTPPRDSFILQHNDVMSLVDTLSRRAFLKFGTDEATLGTVLIDLTPHCKIAENFYVLCSGEIGLSHLETVIYEVSRKGDAGESIYCGDYKYNIGRGGKEVIVGAGKEGGVFQKPKSEGTVCWCGPGDNIVSKFNFIAKDWRHKKTQTVFGKVVSGLNVVKDAISRYPNTIDVKITDCGVILDL